MDVDQDGSSDVSQTVEMEVVLANEATTQSEAREVEVVDDPVAATRLEFLNLQKSSEVSIAMLPAMCPPKLWNTGTWRDYIWPLTPKGARHAQKFLKAVNSEKGKEDVTHFCAACYESGKPLNGCYFKYGATIRANASKHHDDEHDKSNTWKGFTFEKIKDYKGQECSRDPRTQFTQADGTLGTMSQPTTREQLLKAVVEWVVATGQPISATEHPLFRRLTEVVSRVADPKMLNVGRFAVRNRVVKLADERKVVVTKALRDAKHVAFVQFDGWDGLVKIVNFSLFYTSVGNGGKLRLEAFPLSLSQAQLDQITGKMTDEAEVLTLLEKVLEDCGLSIDVLAGAKSHNAMRNVIGTLNRPGLMYRDAQTWANWGDWDKSRLIGCLAHSINLVAQYAISDKGANKDGSIPGGACENGHPGSQLRKALEAAKDANVWLSNEKNFQRALALSKEKNVKLLQAVLPNTTRWNSMLDCIRRALANFRVLSVCRDGNKPVLNLSTAKILAEVEGILEPLGVAQKLLQTTNKPFGPATLPLIHTLLRRYCISMSSILDSTANVDLLLMTHTAFAVADPETGVRKAVLCSQLRAEGHCLLEAIQKHLIYRLVDTRRNLFMYEIVGMFIDPYMKSYTQWVCGKDRESKWNHQNTIRKVLNVLSTFSAEPTDELVESSHESKKAKIVHELDLLDLEAPLECTNPTYIAENALEAELMRFRAEPCPWKEGTDAILGKFSGLCCLLQQYEPLEYWSDQSKRRAYPTLYAANLVTLAYQPTSTFCEALFSTASATPEKSRNRLNETPHLASALVTMRHSLAPEVAQGYAGLDLTAEGDDEDDSLTK